MNEDHSTPSGCVLALVSDGSSTPTQVISLPCDTMRFSGAELMPMPSLLNLMHVLIPGCCPQVVILVGDYAYADNYGGKPQWTWE